MIHLLATYPWLIQFTRCGSFSFDADQDGGSSAEFRWRHTRTSGPQNQGSRTRKNGAEANCLHRRGSGADETTAGLSLGTGQRGPEPAGSAAQHLKFCFPVISPGPVRSAVAAQGHPP